MQGDLTVMNPLEPRQHTQATQEKLPRRALGRATLSLLIVLRVYVIIAIPIVCYAFVHALLTPQH